jgi:hypothetical protein
MMDRRFTLRLPGLLAFVLVAAAALGQEAKSTIHKEDAALLRQWTARLESALGAPQRFSILPRHFSGVYTPAGKDPIFLVYPGRYWNAAEPQTYVSFLNDGGGRFSVLPEGTILRESGGEKVLLQQNSRLRNLFIIRPGKVEQIPLEEGYGSKIFAWRFGDRWAILDQGKLFYADDPKRKEELGGKLIEALALEKDGKLFFVCPGLPGTRKETSVVAYDGKTLSPQVATTFPIGQIQGALLLDDGRWAVVADGKLIPLSNKLNENLPEEELMALLDAIQHQDSVDLQRRLENVSIYPASSLQGLIKVLREEPPPAANLQKTPAAIANALANGFQEWKGCWIKISRVIDNDAANKMIFQGVVNDKYGLFSIDGSGVPTPVLIIDRQRPVAMEGWQYEHQPDGSLYVFGKDKGLGRIKNQALTWIDESDRMKAMTRMLGCDNGNRLYFESGLSISLGREKTTSPLFWCYKPDFPDAPEPEIDHAEDCFGATPVLDTEGRLWFAYPNRDFGNAAANPQENARLPAFRKRLDQAAIRPLTRQGDNLAAATTQEMADAWSLYCLADGALSRCEGVALPARPLLFAGDSGSVFIIPGDGNVPIQLICNDSVYQAKDLHALAQAHPAILLKAAPDSCLMLPKQNLSIVKSRRQIVWIAQNNQVEGYLNGAAMSIQKRLKLLKAEIQNPRFVAFSPGAEEQLLIQASDNYGSNYDGAQQSLFVAVLGEKGIQLGLTYQRSIDQGLLVPYRSKHGKSYYGFNEDASSGRLWLYGNGAQYGRSGQRLLRPFLINQAGAMVCSDYRDDLLVCQPRGPQSLITAAWFRPILPWGELQDGRLLALTPEGLAWLRLDAYAGYVVDQEKKLPFQNQMVHFLGESKTTLFFAFGNDPAKITRLLFVNK